MVANDTQIGGDHYKKRSYEPWDLIIDLMLPYPTGLAVKHVSRWRDKDGIKDLEKAVHCIHKSRESDLWPDKMTTFSNTKAIDTYLAQFCKEDAHILDLILSGHYDAAVGEIEFIIVTKAGELMEEASTKKGTRNTALFMYATELKILSDTKVGKYVHKYNQDFTDPLKIEEVDVLLRTVLEGKPSGS